MAVKLNIWDTQLVLDALEAYPYESKELETLIRRFHWSLKALVGVYERELRIDQFRKAHRRSAPHVNKTPKNEHDAVKLPVGMIMGFMNNPGPDWCLMDGRHLPAEQYPELAGVMTSWCRDGVIMLQDLSDYDVLPARYYVKVHSWPPGLFHLTGDTLHLRCATTGCGQHVSTRYESDGIGSDYCEPCGRKKAQES